VGLETVEREGLKVTEERGGLKVMEERGDVSFSFGVGRRNG
jgi:hypothetical protein